MHVLALVAAILLLAGLIYGVMYACLWLAGYIDAQERDQ